MRRKYPKLLSILLSISVFLIQCNTSEDRNQYDISKISNPLPTIRLEQELYQIPINQTKEGMMALQAKYPDLMDYYITAVMNIQDTTADQTEMLNIMDELIHHPFMVNMYDTIQSVYKDFSAYEKELHLAIKNYQYYFPKSPSVQLVTFTAGIGPRNFYDPPYLGVGLDLYLGKDYPYYPSQGLPDFLIQRFIPKYIATDAAVSLATGEIVDPLKRGSQLLDMMVYYGKLYYISSYFLPKRPIEDFFSYTSEEWEWCEVNKKEIWSFFIDGEWLYAKQFMDYRKFIEDGPTTMGMPQGAPDRVGRWVGYQIVKKYMKEKPNTTFEELINLESGQEILTASKYKP
ncbi:MAG TPA: hypothetical protein VLZ75_09150 [Chitinophagales bacterium]|nr:hypothetical protein [Chitinophagales bacterium]